MSVESGLSVRPFAVWGEDVVFLVSFWKIGDKGIEQRNFSYACIGFWLFDFGLIAFEINRLGDFDFFVFEVDVLELQSKSLAFATAGIHKEQCQKAKFAMYAVFNLVNIFVTWQFPAGLFEFFGGFDEGYGIVADILLCGSIIEDIA